MIGLFSLRFLPLAALATLSLGCGGALTHGTGAPGTTTIHVANHVDEPDVLEALVVTIDGAPLALSTVPPRDADAAVGALAIPPGRHTIAVRATARGEKSDTVVVSANQLFHVSGAPASIAVDVRSRPTGGGADERIAVDLRMVGGRLSEEIGAAASSDKDQRCAPLQPIERAVCRAAADLDAASRRNDVVGVLCVRDRLGEMRRLGHIVEASRGELATVTAQRVANLASEIDRCLGNATMSADGVRVTREATNER